VSTFGEQYHEEPAPNGLRQQDESSLDIGELEILDDAPSGSPHAVTASRNETPCFARFSRAFAGSHSNASTRQG